MISMYLHGLVLVAIVGGIICSFAMIGMVLEDLLTNRTRKAYFYSVLGAVVLGLWVFPLVFGALWKIAYT